MPLTPISLYGLELGYKRLGLPVLLLSLIIRFSILNTTSLLHPTSSHTLLSMPYLKIFHLKHHQSVAPCFFTYVIVDVLSYFAYANPICNIPVPHALYIYHALNSMRFHDCEVANISNIYSTPFRSFYILHHIDMSLITPSSFHLHLHAIHKHTYSVCHLITSMFFNLIIKYLDP